MEMARCAHSQRDQTGRMSILNHYCPSPTHSSTLSQLLNFVRMYDNTWKLTDLDGARVIGTEIDDSKDLSTSIVPPEMTHLLPSGEVALCVRKTNDPAVISYEPLVAEATFDVWSVIACLFPFIGLFPSSRAPFVPALFSFAYHRLCQ